MGLYFIPELGYTLLWRYQATTLTGRQRHVKPVTLSNRHVYVSDKIKQDAAGRLGNKRKGRYVNTFSHDSLIFKGEQIRNCGKDKAKLSRKPNLTGK